MISQKLKSMTGWVLVRKEGISAEEAEHLADVLYSLTKEVEHIESNARPVAAYDRLPGNVISIAMQLHKNGVTTGNKIAPIKPFGGGAA